MCLNGLSSLAETAKPNIVYILADDLGWADINFNGAPFYETPNFNALAEDGMVFDRAYAGGPNCAPTRACLVSGMYTPRHEIWTPGSASKGKAKDMRLLVPNRDNEEGHDILTTKDSLNPEIMSIAEVVKQSGYTTAMLGKWHCGDDMQGFDVFSSNGIKEGHGKHYGSKTVADTLTDGAIEFITENKEKPFFLYLAHFDVHAPIKAKEEVVAKYKKKLAEGDWDHKWNPTYAAMIEAFDKSVGRVRKTLDDLGLSENTLLIVSSDNGATGKTTTGPLKGAKGSLCEGGVRVPTVMYWPKTIQAKTRTNTPITSVDLLPSLADLSGSALPTKQAVDGESFVPLLKGEKTLEKRGIFWHYPMYLTATGRPVVPIFGTEKMHWRAVPSSMIVQGDWKLTYFYEDKSVKLYNVAKDISESKELSKEQPEKAQELLKELLVWVKETKAPQPDVMNPYFGKEVPKKKKSKKGKKK